MCWQQMAYFARVVCFMKKNYLTKRNFEVFSAEDFIGAITQHIPDKFFQNIRYYGCS